MLCRKLYFITFMSICKLIFITKQTREGIIARDYAFCILKLCRNNFEHVNTCFIGAYNLLTSG